MKVIHSDKLPFKNELALSNRKSIKMASSAMAKICCN